MTIRRALPALLLVLILCGCGSTRTADVAGAQGMRFSELNRKARGKVATLHLRDGRRIAVVNVQVAPDSTSWINPKKNHFEQIATSDLREVTIVRAGKGAVAGLALGVLTGAAVGAVRAELEGDDEGAGVLTLARTREEKRVLFPPAHAVYAVLITTPLGAIIGREDHYRIRQPDPAPQAAGY